MLSNKLNLILDSIYIIPAILDHIKEPSDATRDFLYEHDIHDNDIAELRMIKDLLQYHQGVVQRTFAPDIDGYYYTQLRKGLAQYADQYLNRIFIELGLTTCVGNFLDYGAGDGAMARRFQAINPHANVLTLDRHIGNDIVVDFEKNPAWFLPYKSSFDYVLLSEVLHCKDSMWQKYIIENCQQILKVDGTLIIIENEDYAMAYRISKIKKIPTKVVTKSKIDLLTKNKFEMINQLSINKHTAYALRKI